MLKGLLTLALALLVAGCTNSVDQAAKRRIFSPEEPPRAVASAGEKLAPERAAADAHVRERILRMSAAEVTERLGPHRTEATVTFEWSAPKLDPVKLSETRTVDAGPGGVSGDFHATVDNDRDQGMEVIRAEDQVFARSRYGRFRQRLRDRGMAERERERISDALEEVVSLLGNRVKLTSDGTATVDGRTAWRYSVSLGPKPPGEDTSGLPPRAVPKGGPDPTTRLRRYFEGHRQDTALSGELWVDGKTAVVLRAHLDGEMVVPKAKDHPGANLRVTLDEKLSNLGVDPHIVPPKDYLPDEDKPEGIADALERFGIPPASQRPPVVRPDGGTPGRHK